MRTLMQIPNPPPQAPPGLEALSTMILGWFKWGVGISGVFGLLICAIMIMWGRRNRSATAYEGMNGSAFVLAGLAVASSAALIVAAFQL